MFKFYYISDNDNQKERDEDVSNISFDHGDNDPIKKKIVQEIKNEPLDEDNMDC